MRGVLIVGLLAGACRAGNGTATIDEGCQASLDGEGQLGGSPDVLRRVDCYRGYLGLPHMKVAATVQTAAENHAAWMETNDVLGEDPKVTVLNWNGIVAEDDNSEGFSGVSAFQRNVATGTTSASESSSTVWGLFRFEAEVDPDLWIQDPYVRDAMFQPRILGVGEATVTLGGARRAYTDVFALVPSTARVNRPIVYPKDGQRDVPASWTGLWPRWEDHLSDGGVIGFPITLTMSCDQQDRAPLNPFALKVESATVTGEDGAEVDLLVAIPAGNFAPRLRTSVILAPRAPLTADQEYTVDARVTSLCGTTTVHTTFRTAAGPVDTDAPDTDGGDTDVPG